jgi:hypothetical protein
LAAIMTARHVNHGMFRPPADFNVVRGTSLRVGAEQYVVGSARNTPQLTTILSAYSMVSAQSEKSGLLPTPRWSQHARPSAIRNGFVPRQIISL